MQLGEVDWSKLRGALIVLGICVAFSAAVLGSSYVFASAKQEELEKAQRTLQRVRAEYATIDQEEAIIAEYLDKFEARREEGYIALDDRDPRADRLRWSDALNALREELKLPSLRFTLQKEERYRPEFPMPEGTFVPYVTDITLNASLLHEGDLMHILEDLERRGMPGLHTVAACRVLRPTSELVTDLSRGNLESECRIQWLTVKEPVGG